MTSRMPTLYIPHGGGPWPFVDLPMFDRAEIAPLADYLRSIPSALPSLPTALLVISAHWEEPVPTVMTAPRPPMYYDYYGFPPESYEITWPAPGDPARAQRVVSLLQQAGFQTATDDQRGFDHGTFIPLKLAFPEADVPTVQLSLIRGLDPAQHIAMGEALAPLRDEGVLIIGSGMSFHDLRALMTSQGAEPSEKFDRWLQEAATAAAPTRNRMLQEWQKAPSARQAHPREEHLIPLMTAAGAAQKDQGQTKFKGTFAKARISAIQFG